MRLDQFSFLEDIIRKKDPSRLQKSQNVLQPVYILAFCGVHKDHVVWPGKFSENTSRVPFHKSDLFFPSGPAEIFFCQRDSFLIIFYSRNMKILRTVLAHKKCGEAYGCPHLQYPLRLLKRQKHFDKTLHFPPDNGHLRLQSLLFQFFQKRRVSSVQRIDKHSHSLFYDHESAPS